MWFLGKLSTIILFLIMNQGSDPWVLIRNSRYVDARRVIKEALKTASKKDLPELYYLSAVVAKEPNSMTEYLNKVTEISKSGRYFLLANLELAKVNYAQSKCPETISRLNRIIPQCNDSDLRSEMTFWLGLALTDVSASKGSETLRRLIKEFPASRWAGRAQTIVGISNRRYSVQTGAFKTQKNALKQKQKIENYGFDVSIYEKKIDNESFYRVLIGGFEMLEDGLRIADSLKTLGFREARVVGY